MKTCKPLLFTAMTLFAALTITVQTSAQSQTSSSDAAAKGNFTKFDVKGAGTASSQGTFASMNNNEGAITGYYIDANNTAHGFLRAPGGKITRFDVPGSGKYNYLGTYPVAINPRGREIMGSYQDENLLLHGFLRSADGKTFTTIDSPGAGTEINQGTIGRAINPAGTIVGHYSDANNAFHGFVRARDGSIKTFDDPHAGTGANQGTKVPSETGINPKGAIAGWYIDSTGGTHGYVRSANGKKFTTIDGPGAIYTNLADITPNGTIVGYFLDTNNVYHGLLSTPPYKNSTQFDDPNAGTGTYQGTLGYDINPAGAIVGIYIDANNVHGFQLIGNTFTQIDVPGASGTDPSTNNNKGEIVGYYVDDIQAAHGFLWTP